MTTFPGFMPAASVLDSNEFGRRDAFLEEHDEWDISYDRETRSWHAFKLIPHGTEDIYRTLLVYLLDELDKKVSK